MRPRAISVAGLLAVTFGSVGCDPWWWTPIEGVPANTKNPMEPVVEATRVHDDEADGEAEEYQRRCDRDADCTYGRICVKKSSTSASGRCIKGARP